MNQATKDYRKNLADVFIKALSENQLDWKKNWGGLSTPACNAVTGKNYRNCNQFYLSFMAATRAKNGKIDHRWATFNQAQDNGWKIKKGAKGCRVEYWQPYDFLKKEPLTWTEYTKRFAIKEYRENLGVIAKYYTVFNGNDIEGIPELKESEKKEKMVVEDSLIEKIQKGMDIKILYDGGNRAFYRRSTDEIHLPPVESFFSSYDYACTALHELSHATGAPSRLNRDMSGTFGTAKYAYEELVAEISSCFMSQNLQIEQTQEHINNHKAYVQSWIQAISEQPDTLIKAIRDASEAANLLEYHAGILTKEEYLNSRKESFLSEEKKKERPQEKPAPKPSKNIKEELKKAGYKATPALLKKVDRLNQLTGKEHSLKELQKVFKGKMYADNPEAGKVVSEIGKMLQKQELQMKAAIPVR